MPLSINAHPYLKINKVMISKFKLLSYASFFLALSNCANLENSSQSISSSNVQTLSVTADPVVVNVISVTPLKKSSVLTNGDQAAANLELNTRNESSSSGQEFQVIFKYKEQTYSTQLPFDPGATLLIQASPPQIQNEQINRADTPNNLIYSNNDVYILAPTGMIPYPTSSFGFFTGFPVYLSGGYYQRLPGRFYLNHGQRTHSSGGRGKGRK
jgi:hypothetical protein